MAGIRLHLLHHLQARHILLPDQTRVFGKARLRGQLAWVKFGPQPRLRIAKRRHARLGAHPRTSEADDRLRLPENLCCLTDKLVVHVRSILTYSHDWMSWDCRVRQRLPEKLVLHRLA